MVATRGRGVLNVRDQRIITDLYLAPCQTAEQVARGHFAAGGSPSFAAAERKLYRLANKDYVESHSVDTPEGFRRKVWTLTREIWRNEHRDLAANPEKEPDMLLIPRVGRLEHFISSNELYVGSAPMLRRYLGEPLGESSGEVGEGWHWRNEYKCEHEVSLGGKSRKVKPDAELLIADTTLYLENQTKRSHVTPERMREKVEVYAMYFRYVIKDEDDLHQLLVLTEESHIARVVEEKGDELGILVKGGTLSKLLEHVDGTALRLC